MKRCDGKAEISYYTFADEWTAYEFPKIIQIMRKQEEEEDTLSLEIASILVRTKTHTKFVLHFDSDSDGDIEIVDLGFHESKVICISLDQFIVPRM